MERLSPEQHQPQVCGDGSATHRTTNEDGVYAITNLQPGVYEIAVQAANFAKSTQRVQVTVGAKAVAGNRALSSEISTETLTSLTPRALKSTRRLRSLSNVVTGTQIRELPTVTRNPYNLVQLSGNAPLTTQHVAERHGRDVHLPRRGRISEWPARSQHQWSCSTGADNNDSYTAVVGQNIPLDSVQEFRVITSNFSSEYGRRYRRHRECGHARRQQRFPRFGLRLQPALEVASNGFR